MNPRFIWMPVGALAAISQHKRMGAPQHLKRGVRSAPHLPSGEREPGISSMVAEMNLSIQISSKEGL